MAGPATGGSAHGHSAPGGSAQGDRDHLEYIRRAGRTTRRAIAEHTGLSRSVVAQSVAELIAQGLVVERKLAPTTARRGRPTAVLELAHQPGVVVACDLGHHHITVAISDLQSHVLTETRTVFPVDEGAAETFRAVHDLVAASLRRARSTLADVTAFGISFPFPVIMPSGALRAPVALPGWRDVNVADVRPAGFTGPLVYDNDANFGAWGERIHGASPELDNLLYVKLSHGVGAGLIVDGRLLSGARGTAGEMGHMQVEPGGALCRCGRRGCLETVVAASLPDYHRAGLRVGRAIAQLCSFVDAEVLILGGQFGSSGGPLVEGVREAFARFTPGGEDGSAEAGALRVDIRSASLGERSELVGIIDRTLTAAWATQKAHSSWGRTNSGGVLEVPFDAERFVMKE
ncbi:ROK family transcriptional regulator [Herbiconiux sp. P15]|uniref:ROK family transcriptional regulator n=1 Tax=Herbiconiux liukaitaii TaxID=3342799 RepID=UPI0035B81F20